MSRSLIRNNVRGYQPNGYYNDMVAQTFRLNELIHDGLLATLMRVDENFQEWINYSEDYPAFLQFGNVQKMNELFAAMHKRIMEKVFELEHPHECDQHCEELCLHAEAQELERDAEMYF